MNCCGSAAREIAAIRRDLEVLPRDICQVGEEFLALAKAELRKAMKGRRSSPTMTPATGRAPIGANTEEGERADTRRTLGIAKRALVKDYDPEEPRRPKYSAGGGSGPRREEADRQAIFSRDICKICGAAWLIWYRLNCEPITSLGPAKFRRIIRSIRCNSLDSSGRPILDDQGKPMLRPDDLPPEKYAQAGAASHLADTLVHSRAWKSQIDAPMTRTNKRYGWIE